MKMLTFELHAVQHADFCAFLYVSAHYLRGNDSLVP